MQTASRLLAATLFLLLPAPLLAEEEYRPDCSDPQTQSDMNVCAAEDAEAADKDLNAQYKDTMAALDNDAFETIRDRLRKAQRAWIAFRDAQCEAEAAIMEGGSGAPQLLYSCKAEVSRARTGQLKAMKEMF